MKQQKQQRKHQYVLVMDFFVVCRTLKRSKMFFKIAKISMMISTFEIIKTSE